MSIIIQEITKLPEVDTVFELAFAIDLDPASEPHKVSVTCRQHPPETLEIRLHAARPTPLSLQFKSGYALRGTMEVRRDRRSNLPSIGVFAELDYELRGQPAAQHFEGFLFLRETSPEPPTPPSPPMPPDPDG